MSCLVPTCFRCVWTINPAITSPSEPLAKTRPLQLSCATRSRRGSTHPETVRERSGCVDQRVVRRVRVRVFRTRKNRVRVDAQRDAVATLNASLTQVREPSMPNRLPPTTAALRQHCHDHQRSSTAASQHSVDDGEVGGVGIGAGVSTLGGLNSVGLLKPLIICALDFGCIRIDWSGRVEMV